MDSIYTLQIDGHGNSIVCKGEVVRKGYRIEYRGTYRSCMRMKAVFEVA